jgi:selenide,water dikinase
MLRLNKRAAEILSRYSISAATDVTGYGLLGHAYEMMGEGSCSMELETSKIPLLDGARELAEEGALPGGVETNRRYVGDSVTWTAVAELDQKILLDPQTSGGLLATLPESEAQTLIEELHAAGETAARIGAVYQRDDGFRLHVTE